MVALSRLLMPLPRELLVTALLFSFATIILFLKLLSNSILAKVIDLQIVPEQRLSLSKFFGATLFNLHQQSSLYMMLN